MRTRYALIAGLVTSLTLASAGLATAGISYTTVGGTYSENFDNIAVKPGVANNAAIQADSGANDIYDDGWQDDVDPAVSPEDDISIPGWHLFHPLNPGAPENGFNNNQRLRIGTGANTGSFYLYSNGVANGERAIGSQGSTTVAANDTEMFTALQLVNNTGQELHSFTLTFDGEQWRDGQLPTAETMRFSYSTVATDALWTLPGTAIFTRVPTLDYSSPSFGLTGTSGNVVDGNVAGKVPGITATVSGLTWAPGKELWLRWADNQAPSAADDGLGIDNVTFSASAAGTGSSEVTSVAAGPNPSSAGSSWSDNQPPSAGKKYLVLSGHTITVNQLTFDGDYLRAASGGTINFDDNGNGANMRVMIVDAGASLTETATGDFRLGDSFSPQGLGLMTVASNQSFNMDAGADFQLAMQVYGNATLTFNSNGAGSDLILHDVANLEGGIQFNGSGDLVRLVRGQAFDRIEMNSIGMNKLSFEHTQTPGGGTIVFNQPGTLAHATTFTSSNVRLVQKNVLEANAAVTVDLIQPYNPGERRLSFSDSLRGSGNVTVQGSATDPTSLGAQVTLNEFELGSTGDSSGNIPSNTYSGTLRAFDWVNVELRNSLPAARLVIDRFARLEVGRQVVGTAKTTRFGEIQVNSGGILEVGFEQVDLEPITGNHVGHLYLTAANGRTGGLTLTNGTIGNIDDINSLTGSMLVMQVNGKNANEFDTITAEGNIQIDGVLKVLVNPKSSLRDANPIVPSRDFNPVYTPALGDEIVLISAVGTSPSADFIDNNIVDDTDFAAWKAAFGVDATADANGDGDSDGGDFLAWQSQYGQTPVPSTISGTFDKIEFVDVDNNTGVPASDNPDTATPILVDSTGLMSSLGLRFQVQYTSTQVKLVVVNSPVSAVPEPSVAALGFCGLVGLLAARRRQRQASR